MSEKSPVYRLHFPQAEAELFVVVEPKRVHGFFKFPDNRGRVTVDATYTYDAAKDWLALKVKLSGEEHETVFESASTHGAIALDQHGKGSFEFGLHKTHGEQTAQLNEQPIGISVESVLPMVEVTVRKAIAETEQ